VRHTELRRSARFTQEHWIRGLVAFHVALYALAYATTRSDTTQGALFLATSCLLYSSRRLNLLAGDHWPRFSTQNYFDTQGVFAGVMWCAPLILLQTAMVLGFLWRAAKLLVRVKRLELARRGRGKREAREGVQAGDAAVAQPNKSTRRRQRVLA